MHTNIVVRRKNNNRNKAMVRRKAYLKLRRQEEKEKDQWMLIQNLDQKIKLKNRKIILI